MNLNFSILYLQLAAIVVPAVAAGGADGAETGVAACENVSGAVEAVVPSITHVLHGC